MAQLERGATQILGYGGGQQTVAMCLLVEQGIIPRPDYIICADTGRERQSTWDYLNEHIQPRMTALGMPVHVASHELAAVDLYSKQGVLLMPVYTASGKLSTFCSTEWKARVMQRYQRETLGITSSTTWIGFAFDERRRVKASHQDVSGPWYRSYPLIDLFLTKEDCRHVITRAGLPLPSKSCCYMCPHNHNSDWRDIRENHPTQWTEAIRLDVELRESDERGGVFLHQDRVPLSGADIDRDNRQEEGRQCSLFNCMT